MKIGFRYLSVCLLPLFFVVSCDGSSEGTGNANKLDDPATDPVTDPACSASTILSDTC